MNPLEEILRRARERGDFDNLPGAGKPLDLRENPFIPEEWRAAYRMLASNGFAPDIVEQDKALRQRIAALDGRLQKFERRWRTWCGSLPWTEAQHLDRQAARERFLGEYVDEIREINNGIHSFNVAAPTAMKRGTLHVQAVSDAATARLQGPAQRKHPT